MNLHKIISLSLLSFFAFVGFFEVNSQALLMSVSANEKTIHDVAIKWLDYNTEVYLGSKLEFSAYLTTDETFTQFEWSMNKPNIIELSGINKEAKLVALQEGEVEIAACVPDGSNSCIHRNILVKSFEKIPEDQQFIQLGIRAVKQVGINEKNLYVELEQTSDTKQQAEYLSGYLYQLAQLGKLNLDSTDVVHNRFNYYTFSLLNQIKKITIRIDKTQANYQELISIIENYEIYNQQIVPPVLPEGGEEEVPPVVPEGGEEEVPPVVTPGPLPDTPSENIPDQQLPTFDITFGNPEVEVNWQVNQEGSFEAPYQISALETLSEIEQEKVMWRYIQTLEQYYIVTLEERKEDELRIVYKYKISPKENILARTDSEGFYIEFIIDKDNQVSVDLIAPKDEKEENNQDQYSLESKKENSISKENLFLVNALISSENKEQLNEDQAEAEQNTTMVTTVEKDSKETVNYLTQLKLYLAFFGLATLSTLGIILMQTKRGN